MKFIDIRRISNARHYEMEVYKTNGGRSTYCLDADSKVAKVALAHLSQAEVVRIQPVVTADGCPAMEVEVILGEK